MSFPKTIIDITLQCSLRVGVKEPDNEEDYDYHTLMWYHPDCLKKAMPSLHMKNVKAESFSGFTSLRSVDKKKLREMCGEKDETSADTSKGKGYVISKIHFLLEGCSVLERNGKVRVEVDQLKRRARKRTLKKWHLE